MKMKSKMMRGMCFAMAMMLCGCGGGTSSSSSTADTSKSEKKETSMPASGERNFLEQYQEDGSVPSLYELYADNFSIGVAIERVDLSTELKQDTILEQFNSMTCGNEQKADYTLSREKSLANGDEEYPVVDMKNSEVLMQFASECGLKLRYHTLVWWSQTPRWLFTEGFSTDENAPYVSKEVMLKRMENYIQQVMEYCNTNYPGLIYCWDVVNEAIEPNSTSGDNYRCENNLWYEVIGPDYIEKAFEYARKYADPDQKLFYNDYGCYVKEKTFAIYDMAAALKEKGLIDGIGMQSHIGMTDPSILDYEWAITKFATLDVDIQITELDVSQPDNSETGQQQLATRYKKVFEMYKRLDDMGTANITNVTIWGFTDDRSWLSDETGVKYPLLFDKDVQVKPSFFGACLDDSVSMY